MYNFAQLSPADLEDLTRDLLQQHWNLTLESFKKGRDKGIDLRYSSISGQSIIIQCKHFVGSGVAKLLRHLQVDEYPKIAKLNPARYVLATSVPLNPSDKDKIRAVLHPYINSFEDIYGANDLNNLIRLHPEIETQHFKLWLTSTAVLERVLRNATHVQTEFDVNRVRRAIPLYVQTSNYNRALQILEENNVVIISGVPGIGKTTLADMLLFAHLESGYQPVIIKSEIEEGKDLFKEGKAQIFYFDDFLGETFLGNRFDFLGKKEDSAILNFMQMVSRSKGAKLILTTREHVLRHAYHISEHFRRQRGSLIERQCILELSDYTLLDRGRILYNHIYFSDLPFAYKVELLKDGFYMEVLNHRNFNPRLIEWLSRYTNVKALPSAGYREEVDRILENPEQLWLIAFEQQISDACRSVLLALYSLDGDAHLSQLKNTWKVLHQYRAKKYNWKMVPEEFRRSLQDLEGGFLRFENNHATFINPSVKDFFDTMLANSMDNLDDLLSAACSFKQIVTVWSLVQSPKGQKLQSFFTQSPEQLMGAVNQNLQNLHAERVEVGQGMIATRELDVRPEIRLRTMLSIAENTTSYLVLNAAAEYRFKVIDFWLDHRPDFSEAVQILKALNAKSTWALECKSSIYEDLKRAILNELSGSGDSKDFVAVVDNIDSNNRWWTDENRRSVVSSFRDYLETGFEAELGDFDTEEEFQELSERIESIASWCEIDVESYLEQISNIIDDLEPANYEDVDSIREWDRAGQLMPEHEQQAEVVRMFDGLLQRIDN